MIEAKAFSFSVRIVRLYQHLKDKKKEYVLSKQVLRSGTSVCANVTEAEQAQSRADFISKNAIALKEAVETNYWLRLLHATDYITDREFQSMIHDCRELERMLTCIIKTSRGQEQ